MRNLTDRQYEFLMSEYETLRKEIENSKDRVFKIVAGEAILIPAVEFLIELGKEELTPEIIGRIYLVMPLLISVFVSQFLYENNCIFRAGFYIRSYIEPIYSEKITDYPYLGWEEWLEEWLEDVEENSEDSESRKWWKHCISFLNKNCVSELKNRVSEHFTTSKPHRSVDKYVKQCFYLLSAVYYFAIVNLAWKHYPEDLNNIKSYLLLGYVLLSIYMAWKIGTNAWTNTFMKDFLSKDIDKEDLIILNKAIKICPRDSELWKRKGDIFIKSKNLQDGINAINAYDKAIEMNPRDALAWSCKGDALERGDNHEAANEAYDKALELDQSFASAWAGKYNALKALGRVAESEVALSKARELCGID